MRKMSLQNHSLVEIQLFLQPIKVTLELAKQVFDAL